MGCARAWIDPRTGEPTGFACGEGVVACSVCGVWAERLCDYPLGKGRTCDAPLCSNHAIPVRPFPQKRLRVQDDADAEWVEFCPQHYTLHAGPESPEDKP